MSSRPLSFVLLLLAGCDEAALDTSTSWDDQPDDLSAGPLEVDALGDAETLFEPLGVSCPAVVVAERELLAQAEPGQEAELTLHLSNICSDGEPVKLQDVWITDHHGGFSLLDDVAGMVIEPGDQAEFDFLFSPSERGVYVADVQLVTNDPRIPTATVTLYGVTGNEDGRKSGSPPVADAGGNQDAITGDTVILDGSATTDPEGDTLSYAWTFLSVESGSALTSGDISGSSTDTASFVPDLDGAYRLRFVVSDGTSVDKDFAWVWTSDGLNTAPVADAGAEMFAQTGYPTTADGSGSSDADGDTLTYLWGVPLVPTGSAVTAASFDSKTSVTPTFTPDLDGDYRLRLKVSDSVDTDKDFVWVRSSSTNTAPVAEAGANQTGSTGSVHTLDGTASSDVDGDTLTYAWSFKSVPTGSALNNAALTDRFTAAPSFTSDVDGTYRLRLVVDDGLLTSKDFVNVVTTTSSGTDADLDGYDSIATGGTDCDDTDATVNPGAAETWYDGVDSDCDGASDYDADADTEDSDAYGGTDCDDTDSGVNTAATETWYDGVDSDCDGASDYDADADTEDSDAYGGTDCDDTDSGVNTAATETWYDGVDSDCDGASDYDADADTEDSDAYGGTDCDDTDSGVNTAATETWYDGVDSDCDGASDYDADADTEDSDAYGGTDCDDTDSGVNTGATETWYDGVDSDCDGASDYDADADTEDSDAYGGTDCDDTDSGVNTGATETWYDGVDSDCDGASDYDADGDTEDSDAYGGTDCDDTDSGVNTGATETWYDGTDSDCDGASDYDADGDSYDSDAYSGTDCDDTDASINPGATEINGDGIDQDCDGVDSYTYTWTDVDAILSTECAGCHLGGGSSGGFNFDGGYSDLVDVPSIDVPTMDYVEPSDSANSYLWHKLSDTQASVGGSGVSMPYASSLSSAELDLIETWIDEGAPE